jgi:two-component system cell cycle sensor histidine kinase/response regulator CckA
MSRPLRVLIVEDSETDAKLVVHTLRQAGHEIEFERVEEATALIGALSRCAWDLVISDWTMPRLRCRDALAIVRAAQPDAPFIIVSGTAGEHNAVEAMRAGAQDYVFKGNLTRLPPAVERELREGKDRASHRRAQETLRESEARYRALFENSPLPKWLYDLETLRILTVNDAAVLHYGYSREEFLQMTVKDLMPPKDVAALVHHVQRVGLGPRSLGAWRNKKKDGTVIDVEVTGHTFALESRLTRLVVVQDITERRRAEEALRASEEQMRLLLDSTGEGIYGIDLRGNCTLANAACVRMLGYRHESELLGRNVHQMAHHTRENGAPYPVGECRIYQSGLRDEGAILDDEILWRKDGSNFPAELRSFPLMRGGERVGAVVSFVDITTRKKAEEATHLLADLVRASWDAIIVTDPAGLITSWNPSAERTFEYAAEEVLGKSIAIIVPPDRLAEVDQLLAQMQRGGLVKGFETVRVRKDGRRIDISLTLTFIRNADGTIRAISGVNRDITERRAVEEQVRLLHNIVLAAGEAVTLDETLEVVLRLICQASGVLLANAWVPDSRGKLERRGQWARPEHRERFRPFVEGWSFENGVGLPGRVWAGKVPVWIANLAVAENFPRAAVAAELGLRAGVAVPILVGEELIAVIEAFLPQPSEENTSLIALLSAVGAQIGSVVQRRRVEEALRKSEEQFRQAQKMEAIGQLTGGVAHDFNNLLSVILSYSGLLAEDLAPDDPSRKDLLEIKAAGERAAALTQQLLAFSRRQVLQPRVMDLNLIVGGMEEMLRRLIGEDVELTVIKALAPAMVNVDPGQMEQVVMNLAVNARDAMPTGGMLTIGIAGVELDEVFVSEHTDVTAGPHVMLAVSDTGCGMDAATQARVFEPFFTTKERGRGTGLGLSTVFGIVRQSAGTIWLYSEPGMGTTFKVYLPVAEAGAEQALAKRVEPARLQGSETVLLVEDEEGVRKLVRSILQRNGYRVLEAKDGADALRIAEMQPAIDVLLTDVVMPHMSGAETAARLLAIRPGLKLLYMSGYTDDAVVLHGVLRSEAAFVQKPITPDALLSKVREVLDSSAAPAEEKAQGQ